MFRIPTGSFTLLKEILASILRLPEATVEEGANTPHVILMIGVNGVGKTTTIGKLAHRYQGGGKTVLLAAGDTFRAAAIEQLKSWGERNGVPVIAQDTERIRHQSYTTRVNLQRLAVLISF